MKKCINLLLLLLLLLLLFSDSPAVLLRLCPCRATVNGRLGRYTFVPGLVRTQLTAPVENAYRRARRWWGDSHGGVSFRTSSSKSYPAVKQTGASEAGRRVYLHVDSCYSCLPCVHKNSVTECQAMPLQVTLGYVILFLPLSTNVFRQSSYITTLLTDPRSYRLRSQFLAVILLILIAIRRQATESPDPSPVPALCRRCSDVTTSNPGLGANEITSVSLV
jgi:hypothetical protein